ncbi:MAG: hypothetical protein AB7F08_14070 [Dongiaceae bacterium]
MIIRRLSIPVLLVLWTSSPTFAADSIVQMSREDCAQVVKHQPAADVAYQPGVDAHGNAVAPADLPGTPTLALPPEIPVLISVDLQDRYNLPANSALYEGNAGIGVAMVDMNGNVTFNGKPLTDPESSALAAACQQAMQPAPEPAPAQ